MYDLQNGCCFYCEGVLQEISEAGRKIAQNSPGRLPAIDHFEPKSKGGRNDWGNKVWACYECNNLEKRDRMPTEEEKGQFEELQKRFWARIEELQQQQRKENAKKRESKNTTTE